MKAYKNSIPLSFSEKVGCKINIFLSIGKATDDGFHTIKTLFYPLPKPYDTITITENNTDTCIVESSVSIPNTDNIVYKTYMHAQDFLKSKGERFPYGYSINIDKHIPMGGGLGGGSANAGYFLRYLQKRFGKNIFPDSILHTIASKVGSDVPFFLHNAPMLAEGRGEILQKSTFELSGKYIVILILRERVSTESAFKALDIYRKKNKKVLTNFPKYSKNYQGLTLFTNDFEEVLFKQYPQMRKCKENLLRFGAIFAMLSGSGSSIFGIFYNAKSASKAVNSVQDIVEGVYSYYL